MKSTPLLSFALMAVGMVLTTNPAFGEEKVNVYEMAESGITVEFTASSTDKATAEGEPAEPVAARDAGDANPRKRVRLIEMGESGQSVLFPMTAAEIAAEDAEEARRAAARKAKSDADNTGSITYELAESGITLEFAGEIPDNPVVEAKSLEAADDLKI